MGNDDKSREKGASNGVLMIPIKFAFLILE